MVATSRGRMMATATTLVVGAGTTGLTLALQAHALGAHVRIIERRSEAFRPSRALIMHPRTLEELRPLGVTDALLARADIAPEAYLRLGSRTVHVRLANLALPDTEFPHLTLIRQMDVETALTQALASRGVEVERGVELTDLQDSADGVRATLQSQNGEERIECAFVVGCDGPESVVRRQADIVWHGRPYRHEIVLADVELDSDLARGAAHVVAGRRGLLFVFALGERATWRLLATRRAGVDTLPYGQPGPPVPIAELQALLDDARLGARITKLVWSARYRVQRRLASRFSRGHLFIAGDAAHGFSPATGQGMNTGIQDAINLGWKLAFAGSATAPLALLNSYDLERWLVARQTLAMTHLAFWAEASTNPLPSLLRGTFAPLGAPAVPALIGQRWLVAEGIRWISQLRVAYPDSPLSAEGEHAPRLGPPAGYRMPDMSVISDGQRVRLHSLLSQPGVHIVLEGSAPALTGLNLGPHVLTHRLTSAPGSGVVVVRPDGYVGFRSATVDPGELAHWLAWIGAGTPRVHSALGKQVNWL